MITKKLDHELNHLVVLDFDGTIFFNSSQNFSIDIPLGDILDAQTFFSEFTYQTGRILPKNTEFILITGRNTSQQDFILELVKAKGYKINQAHFSQITKTNQMDESSFMIEYWTAKVKLINQINRDSQYESITTLDDDPVICSMLEKLNFDVFRVEVTKDIVKQSLSVLFNPPQKRLMTELCSMLRDRQIRIKKPLTLRV